MADTGIAARRSALWLCSKVMGEGRMMSELLPRGVDTLAPDNRARAQRLAMDLMRWANRSDRMLGPFLRQKPDEAVLNILRLGVVELCQHKSAPHGVINSCVEVAKESTNTVRGSGLVNAVLRKVARNVDGWQTLPTPQLPKWLRKPLRDAYGKSVLGEIEMAHAAAVPIDLTVKNEPSGALAGKILPNGSLRLEPGAEITQLPGYDAGDWWVQDAAASMPARLLAARAGERVLDMCAAPGGKTMQLAAAGAEVTALDVSADRMERVRANLARTDLTAECVVGDAMTYEADRFDAVLLDAPCSATGTIRRHPDLPFAKDGADFPELFAKQSAMIDRAVRLLRPGGRLIYCTCSLLPDEGEVQIEEALARQPNLSVDEAAMQAPWIEPEWRGPEGLRLRPDYWSDVGGMDGFFISALKVA